MRSEDVRRLFDGRRLRAARELRALSQKAVAVKVEELSGESISSAAISQYEKGDATPATDRIDVLAVALDVPSGYFARVQPADPDVPAFFRSLRSTSATQRKRARSIAHLAWQFTKALEQHVRLPDYDVPRYPLPLDARRQQVEAAAAAVRRHWNVDPGPIEHVVKELENHGVIVVRILTGEERMDAFSILFDDRPVVVLTDDKNDRSRSRFDAAHELGHLVMHDREGHGSKEAEQQAHWFAAAFLMPEDDIRHSLRDHADWKLLLDLKQYWDVSVQALLKRSETLDVMSRGIYVQSMKTLSARGWRKNEPGSLGAPERPTLLNRALKVVTEAGIANLDSIVAEAHLPEKDVAELLGASRDPRPRVSV